MQDLDVKVIVTIIAALVSFIGLIIAKDHKVSEFRQSWINDFRDGVSELLGCVINIHAHYIIAESENENDDNNKAEVTFIKNSHELYNDAHRIVYKLKLMLNPKKDHDLISAISRVEAMIIDSDKLDDESHFHDVTDKLYKLSHNTLKNEWTRVKKGEFVFHSTKYLLGLTMIFFVITYIADIVLKT
ncbi:TPA: hypothetical protein I7288_23120 [Vibrio parahaemolyticus]|nr:hypothetical protein [Vibrio parahaemolyticus]